MINFLTDAIENAIDVVTAPINGEDVSKKQVSKLITDAVIIGATVSGVNTALDIIDKMIDD